MSCGNVEIGGSRLESAKVECGSTGPARLPSSASAAVTAGEPWPLGAHPCCDGTNFAVFSRHATHVELWVFEDINARVPSILIVLDPKPHRTGDIWHVRIGANLRGRCYMFRASGPPGSDARHQFDPEQLLLDPYAHAIAVRPEAVVQSGDVQIPGEFRCAFNNIVVDNDFDWQDVTSPQHPWSDTIIYETHVRGLTMHPSSTVRCRGQYLGVIEKIPYLKSLGITAVELLPVQAFNMRQKPRPTGPAPQVTDYWGYNPIALFAPHPGYGSGPRSESPTADFKSMVRELHRAGIEVILDVVFNHTGEGGVDGPIFSFRGLDNDIYYLLSPDGHGYLDYTGCGNTLNCNHPVVRSMILNCLRHWTVDLHVDGFRFDLAAVLGRGEDGKCSSTRPCSMRLRKIPSCAAPSSSQRLGMPQAHLRSVNLPGRDGANGIVTFATTSAGSGAEIET
jgi:isoamylase